MKKTTAAVFVILFAAVASAQDDTADESQAGEGPHAEGHRGQPASREEGRSTPDPAEEGDHQPGRKSGDHPGQRETADQFPSKEAKDRAVQGRSEAVGPEGLHQGVPGRDKFYYGSLTYPLKIGDIGHVYPGKEQR